MDLPMGDSGHPKSAISGTQDGPWTDPGETLKKGPQKGDFLDPKSGHFFDPWRPKSGPARPRLGVPYRPLLMWDNGKKIRLEFGPFCDFGKFVTLARFFDFFSKKSEILKNPKKTTPPYVVFPIFRFSDEKNFLGAD